MHQKVLLFCCSVFCKDTDYQHNVGNDDNKCAWIVITTDICRFFDLHYHYFTPKTEVKIGLPCQDHSHCQDFDVNDLLSELPARSGVELKR